MAGWTSSFAIASGLSVIDGDRVLSSHWLGVIVSRALFSNRVDRAKEAAVERSAVLSALRARLVLVVSSSPVLVCAGPFAVGVCMALVMPTSLALAGERIQGNPGALFGGLLTVAQVGGIILPAPIGLVAEQTSVRAWASRCSSAATVPSRSSSGVFRPTSTSSRRKPGRIRDHTEEDHDSRTLCTDDLRTIPNRVRLPVFVLRPPEDVRVVRRTGSAADEPAGRGGRDRNCLRLPDHGWALHQSCAAFLASGEMAVAFWYIHVSVIGYGTKGPGTADGVVTALEQWALMPRRSASHFSTLRREAQASGASTRRCEGSKSSRLWALSPSQSLRARYPCRPASPQLSRRTPHRTPGTPRRPLHDQRDRARAPQPQRIVASRRRSRCRGVSTLDRGGQRGPSRCCARWRSGGAVRSRFVARRARQRGRGWNLDRPLANEPRPSAQRRGSRRHSGSRASRIAN